MASGDVMNEILNKEQFHLGHMVIAALLDRPDDICQIDAATGQKETNSSVLRRSIRLARGFRELGYRPGDVLALGGNNHLDLFIPYYAALINGLPIVGIDPLFKLDELKTVFRITEPKIAFCEYESYKVFTQAVKDLGLSTKIITFNKGECTFNDIMESCEENNDLEFSPESFDTDKVYAWLLTTSGTSGVPKVAAFKHRPLVKALYNQRAKRGPSLYLNLSPIQWISAFINALAVVFNGSRVQTSAYGTTEHVIDIINEYKPSTVFCSPYTISLILNNKKQCDFTCFDVICLIGSKLKDDMIIQLKSKMRKDAVVAVGYGQTETFGIALAPNPHGPIGNCGTPIPNVAVKLVDPETGKEIKEPNVTGELWLKDGTMFSEYYKNPEETAKAFTEDGWYKSGDLLYRDVNDNFFFVERLKMLIKYQSHHVIPLEVEEVIKQHEGVLDVCVTGVPHAVDWERTVACVVRHPGSGVTAQDIKDLVSDKLQIYKQLTGGVVFVDKLPMTSTGKVARSKIRELVLNAQKE